MSSNRVADAQANLADYQWLVGPEAGEVLNGLASSPHLAHQQAAQLRRFFAPARVHLLLEQADLRQRARTKFSAAHRMFFTRVGLEQATDEAIARYKSSRFNGNHSVVDLCCGIGGDLMALARRGQTTGVDLCPKTLALAHANTRVVSDSTSKIACQPSEDTQVAQFDAWHIDPDRRPHGRKTTRVELHSPTAAALDGLLQQNPNAAMKLAPASDPPQQWQDRCELEWISRAGECKQLVAWSGALASAPGQRRATALAPGGELLGSVKGVPDEPAPIAQQVGQCLYEPDAAVFAAGLDGWIANHHGIERMSRESGYLTGPSDVDSPMLSGFLIEEMLSPRPKQLARYFQQRGIGTLEIKQRGARMDLDTLRRQLRLRGENASTLLLTRRGPKTIAFVARRL